MGQPVVELADAAQGVGARCCAGTFREEKLEQRTLQTIDNPFGTRLSPIS